ncbi:MAG: dihydroorotate dehydrogenase (quinone) [Pseudomonadales bacterium]|nr:dihydroorotate dehydrogenase (quinone) [Pseudomonadales bacterium]
MFYTLLRQLLFLFPTETSHHLALTAMTLAYRLGLTRLRPGPPSAPVECFGLRFPNPVGLAAGLDKNGDYIDALGALGFGFIEIGTVTPRPQPGNPKPRLFRLPARQAIINRMGFNNKGVDYLVTQVQRSRYRGVLGINIGKNFDTPVEQALDDYRLCLEKVYPHADYVVVNISSPNTQGLRSLQYGDSLSALLSGLQQAREHLTQQHGKTVPLLVKIAPDFTSEEITRIATQFREHQVDGVIATNTTLSREGVSGQPQGDEAGGLSGAPLFTRSTQVLEQLCQHMRGEIPVIGVGGILSGEQAVVKQQAGASLVQVYTGFIYRGPALITDCVRAWCRLK